MRPVGALVERRPRVSVILIFFNEERFLADAIESVLAQSYPEWELLLVDDGSTDRSPEIARAHAARLPARIRYLTHPNRANRGQAASRNRGIDDASGDYLSFLDGDDVYLREKLETQVGLLEACPRAGVACGPTEHWFSWQAHAREPDFVAELGFETEVVLDPPALVPALLRGSQFPAVCSWLVRREVAKAIGGFEDTAAAGLFEDQTFLYKACLRTPVLVHTDCLDRYRQRDDGTCARAARSGVFNPAGPSRSHQQFLEWFRGHLERNAIDDPVLARALRWAERRNRRPRVHQARQRLRVLLPGLAARARARRLHRARAHANHG